MEFQLSYFKSWNMMLWKSAALNIPAHLENSAVSTGLEKSVFIPIPKKGNAKECSNYRTIALISHASKVMLKILQARLQLTELNWTAACQASLSITNSQSLLKLMSIESVMPFNHSLSSPSPPAFNLSQHQDLFQGVGSSHQVAKELEFQLQHQSLQWIFRTDFL